ncbi:MAG: DNA ligase [Alicyclobacillus sp.]|nr:DNA ligase [Alicyclobacillus sp.]
MGNRRVSTEEATQAGGTGVREEARALAPVTPMEPVLRPAVPQGPGWLAQVKWDGVRLLVHWAAGEVRVYNRHRRDRTAYYPELLQPWTYCRAGSVVLDGEAVALGEDGKPDFYRVLRREGLRSPHRVAGAMEQVPVHYMVFDVLYGDGQWLTGWPLSERLAWLERNLLPHVGVQRVPVHAQPGVLWQAVQELQLEGVVVKRADSVYRLGQTHPDWVKVKRLGCLSAVVGGLAVNESGQPKSMLLGLWDDQGRLTYIGHAGPGHLARQWPLYVARWLSQPAKICPFQPVPRTRDTLWLQPAVVVQVQFAGWTPQRTLRHPVVLSAEGEPLAACTWRQVLPAQSRTDLTGARQRRLDPSDQ